MSLSAHFGGFFFRLIYKGIGYLYMRIRYGKHHKRQLISKFAKDYYYAGLTIIWLPFCFVAVIVFAYALVWIIISQIWE